jgi:hypothetical protein
MQDVIGSSLQLMREIWAGVLLSSLQCWFGGFIEAGVVQLLAADTQMLARHKAFIAANGLESICGRIYISKQV